MISMVPLVSARTDVEWFIRLFLIIRYLFSICSNRIRLSQ